MNLVKYEVENLGGNRMLLELVKALEGIELDYTLVSLSRLDIKFDNFICVVTIRDIYSCYIIQEGDIIDVAKFNTAQSVIDFLTYYDLVLA